MYFTHPDNPDRGEPLIYTCQVPPAEVAASLAAAEAGGFDRFDSHYSVGDAMDVETNALSFLIHGELKRVEAFGADLMVSINDSAEMKTYCDLWDRIEQLLPYRAE